jgi:hypothetical protein
MPISATRASLPRGSLWHFQSPLVAGKNLRFGVIIEE